MILHLSIFMIVLIIIQLAIGHMIHEIGFSYFISIVLMCLPLGLGIYLLQIVYFEQKYPNWNVSLRVKLRLKYMFILTFIEYVALYICFFTF